MALSNKDSGFRSGYVSIIGRPNVGKSTLLNSIVGEKVSIVTTKPQTTQRRIRGIRTTNESQIIFVDTPGIHKPRHKLGEYMSREALEALNDVDLVLFMVEPKMPGPGDRFIINLLKSVRSPVFLLINKTDTVKKATVLPVIDAYSRLYEFSAIMPLSAIEPADIDMLLNEITLKLPVGPKYYPDDIITDGYERSVVSDLIREKVMEATEEEVPHSAAVEILKWKEREDGLLSISANIYVEKESQKGIIIGKKGERLKLIGTKARADIEKLTGRKVFIELWVKVKEDWRRDEMALKELGFR